ncbi:hypothetical protein OOZ19_08905 [Saccharopolyspora sp. NFXS83]|uniref:hypothetical protein n=1 Tax=Saccharopolyspora sp. NFXS83 TaxID=2993560 RepID=UPI00224B8D9A|nr:hypothetical protein [Saccharopolyspora sp. NFXS83]MCX2730358.1 hypothetical protein [Saccharopolyspora sp. NFXS83]
MSSSATATRNDGTGTAAEAVESAESLRALYYVRFGFALVWVALLTAMAGTLGPAVIALLVLYPLFDVVAAVIDFRSSGAARPKAPLCINMGLSLLAAAGLAVAIPAGAPGVLRVWGAWAITAGLVQLLVAILRYRLGGQWAMILSGGISTIAGTSFILMANGPDASLGSVAGYALLGGIFFLFSALRLHRLAAKAR